MTALHEVALVLASCAAFGTFEPGSVDTPPKAEHAIESKPQQQALGPHDWLIKHETIRNLLKSTNEERKRQGLPALKLNARMCLAAQKHAVWMAENAYFQHSDLPWPEVIHHGPTSAEEAVQGWIWSPAHYGILLSGRQVGFGYMMIDGRTYWVGVFK